MSRPFVLSIAGHDPSGGAGVSADQRVIEACGCASLTAVTAITVQNSAGVQSVHPVDSAVLLSQIDALFDDFPIAAVKIGMLAASAQVQAVCEALARYRPRNIVLDPVLASTGGVPLLDAAGAARLLAGLVPLADICTPNMPEAAALTGMRVSDIDSMRAAGRRFLQLGARCALVKGGHIDGDPADVMLFDASDGIVLKGARIQTRHTHGTGCFLSSAIAAKLALGLTPAAAVSEAREMLRAALTRPVVGGKGRGYPNANVN